MVLALALLASLPLGRSQPYVPGALVRRARAAEGIVIERWRLIASGNRLVKGQRLAKIVVAAKPTDYWPFITLSCDGTKLALAPQPESMPFVWIVDLVHSRVSRKVPVSHPQEIMWDDTSTQILLSTGDPAHVSTLVVMDLDGRMRSVASGPLRGYWLDDHRIVAGAWMHNGKPISRRSAYETLTYDDTSSRMVNRHGCSLRTTVHDLRTGKENEVPPAMALALLSGGSQPRGGQPKWRSAFLKFMAEEIWLPVRNGYTFAEHRSVITWWSRGSIEQNNQEKHGILASIGGAIHMIEVVAGLTGPISRVLPDGTLAFWGASSVAGAPAQLDNGIPVYVVDPAHGKVRSWIVDAPIGETSDSLIQFERR